MCVYNGVKISLTTRPGGLNICIPLDPSANESSSLRNHTFGEINSLRVDILRKMEVNYIRSFFLFSCLGPIGGHSCGIYLALMVFRGVEGSQTELQFTVVITICNKMRT